jgi:hypothetical protein
LIPELARDTVPSEGQRNGSFKKSYAPRAAAFEDAANELT